MIGPQGTDLQLSHGPTLPKSGSTQAQLAHATMPAPVSWICLLSVGSVHAKEAIDPIVDGWWSIITVLLNCVVGVSPIAPPFSQRRGEIAGEVDLDMPGMRNVECGEAGEAYCSS